METKEVGREFLSRVCDYLVSLPFDLKVLQEALSDLDLDPGARELCAGVLIHALCPREGSGAERYIEDVFLLRVALSGLLEGGSGGDGAAAFRARFGEVYARLQDDVLL